MSTPRYDRHLLTIITDQGPRQVAGWRRGPLFAHRSWGAKPEDPASPDYGYSISHAPSGLLLMNTLLRSQAVRAVTILARDYPALFGESLGQAPVEEKLRARAVLDRVAHGGPSHG